MGSCGKAIHDDFVNSCVMARAGAGAGARAGQCSKHGTRFARNQSHEARPWSMVCLQVRFHGFVRVRACDCVHARAYALAPRSQPLKCTHTVCWCIVYARTLACSFMCMIHGHASAYLPAIGSSFAFRRKPQRASHAWRHCMYWASLSTLRCRA